jgi:chemotaxis protein MotA
VNISLWVGFSLGAYLCYWGVTSSGSVGALINAHGLVIVVGGTAAATLVSHPLSRMITAFRQLLILFSPTKIPTPAEAIEEAVRLARVAQEGGGLLSLQDEGREFADGFGHRAITVAIASGEFARTRSVMVTQIKQTRIMRMEDANVFRTIGVLSPMFGILGTLLGMIQVLGSLQDPSKVGPAMALALSSAFVGIAIANFICIPLAGQVRLEAQRETLVYDILLEGILDIQAGKAPYLVELALASFSQERQSELAAAESADVQPAGGTP